MKAPVSILAGRRRSASQGDSTLRGREQAPIFASMTIVQDTAFVRAGKKEAQYRSFPFRTFPLLTRQNDLRQLNCLVRVALVPGRLPQVAILYSTERKAYEKTTVLTSPPHSDRWDALSRACLCRH